MSFSGTASKAAHDVETLLVRVASHRVALQTLKAIRLGVNNPVRKPLLPQTTILSCVVSAKVALSEERHTGGGLAKDRLAHPSGLVGSASENHSGQWVEASEAEVNSCHAKPIPHPLDSDRGGWASHTWHRAIVKVAIVFQVPWS